MDDTDTPIGVLIVDDEPAILRSLARVLRDLPITLKLSESPADALHLLSDWSPQIIISDQRMPLLKGTEFQAQVAQKLPDSTRVILSSHADFDEITEAFNRGIINRFISKPWDDQELRYLIESESNRSEALLGHNFHGILSQSARVHEACAKIVKAARANVPVFIGGETGTGKELAARALHEEGPRKGRPFIAFNCANFSENLMESQLFGHVKGAFTGAHADAVGLLQQVEDGTLFLDEVATLPVSLQSKLLRVLQEREFCQLGSFKTISFRGEIISAASTQLSEAIETNDFRPDLRYRLEVIPITLPPLRERREDLPWLFLHFLQEYSDSGDIWTLDADAQRAIEHCHWPGNIRQLQNVAQYVAAMSEDRAVTLEDLPDDVATPTGTTATITEAPDNAIDLKQLDRDQLLRIIQECHNNRSEAARRLGVSRMTLWRRMKALNLD